MNPKTPSPAFKAGLCFFLTAVCCLSAFADGAVGQPVPAGPAAPIEIAVDLSGSYKFGPNGDEQDQAAFSPAGRFSFSSSSPYFDVMASLSLDRDGKYGAALADIPGGNLYGFYALLDEGGVRARLVGAQVELGRFRFQDEVDSPYSLFVNSNGISGPGMAISYAAGSFFYNSRWIGLNHDSMAGISEAWPSGFPERGATIKSFGLEIGEMRFGFQDAIVYAGRWFDFEYFLSPLPMYATQYVRGTGGAPWAASYDDNTIMGFFWTWNRPGAFSCLAQVLVDDIGFGGILDGWPLNPWQLAAGLGGRMETQAGSFGLYAAMATKYCFEPSSANSSTDAYGYTWYPDTRFTSYWQDIASTVTSPISVEDNEIGYKYGENNLAIQVDWKGKLGPVDATALLEFRLSGSNSPANPGHDDASILSEGTKWLDDAVLEKRIVLALAVSKAFGPLRIYGNVLGGYALDALTLRAAEGTSTGANSAWIYSPAAGTDKALFSISVGGRYATGLGGRQ